MSKHNENRPGYKKTKIGWVPEKWKSTTLKDICLKITDGEHKTPKRTSKGIYLLSARNIRDGFIDLSNVDYIDLSEFIKLSKRVLPRKGDVLISCSGSIGRCAVITNDIQFSMVRSVALVRPNSAIVNPKYLLFILSSKNLQWQILSSINQMAQGNLFQSSIKSLWIAYPELVEQQKIAEILSTWDLAIEQTKKLIEAKQKLKKGLMQQLLTGCMRFPKFSKPVKNKGELPDGWKISKLENFFIKEKGKKVVTNKDKKGLPYIGSASFDGGYNEYTIDNSGVKCDVKDILLLWDGENAGKVSIGHNGIVSSTVVALRLKNKNINSSFVTNYILSQNKKIRSVREGSGIPHMPGDFLCWFRIHLPTLDEQIKIASIFTAKDKEIELLLWSKIMLQNQKKGLMQKLLTGEIRVKI